ncbi:hypothetical protein ACFQ1I_35745 [Kitasatospora arboriphila]
METRNVPTPSAGTAALAPDPHRPAPHVPPRTLRARRRRPAVLAMAVALIAAGGLGGAALYTSSGQRIAVLAVARDIPMGQAVTADDLVVAHIAATRCCARWTPGTGPAPSACAPPPTSSAAPCCSRRT